MDATIEPGAPGRSDDAAFGPESDGTAEAIIALLRSHGASDLPHGRRRKLLEHLVGTYSIMRCWRQPVWLQHAALIHSVYGTDAYREEPLPLSSREALAAVAGSRAERIAYLFCVTPRGPLLAGMHRWARDLPSRSGRAGGGAQEGAAGAREGAAGGQEAPPTRDELDAVVLLHLANIAEQAQSADGSPASWLAKLGGSAQLLADSETLTLPPFFAQLITFSEGDESRARAAYRDAVRRADDAEARMTRFALVAAVCPVVAEPCVWLAALGRRSGDAVASSSWATQARDRLLGLGTAWDKRLSFEQWLVVIGRLEREQGEDGRIAVNHIVHPRALFDALVGHTGPARSVRGGSAPSARGRSTPSARGGSTPSEEGIKPPSEEPIKPPDAAAGRKRFQRYIEGLAGADDPRSGAIYPDLRSRPWYDPADFGLVHYLESNYAAIREELLSLEAPLFHAESERIPRTGDWDVAFLYERGRRHDQTCAACPVTTRGIESFPTLRTSAGLIYVSRMRGSTHIEAHRAPTNLRVRCHLGLKVPDGDCAIRVGDETRAWQEGRCLVFDDFFEHEAWNRTAETRVVLIVDMWHPGLSSTEITLLEGLHNYTHAHAQRLNRYWELNAAASRQARQPNATG